jgi:hypothetical protein
MDQTYIFWEKESKLYKTLKLKNKKFRIKKSRLKIKPEKSKRKRRRMQARNNKLNKTTLILQLTKSQYVCLNLCSLNSMYLETSKTRRKLLTRIQLVKSSKALAGISPGNSVKEHTD